MMMANSPPKPFSIRTHPETSTLFKNAESRHFSDLEIASFLQVFPDLQARTDASREIREADKILIPDLVNDIFELYPYEEFHEYGKGKCVRDVKYNLAYATHAMVADDAAWFEAKLLLWEKTILQSFQFPDLRPANARPAIDPQLERALSKIKPGVRSIYHTYTLLEARVCELISDNAASLIRPFLQLTTRVLSEE